MAGFIYPNPLPLLAEGGWRIEGWKPVEIIPIDQAVLCADCDAITRAKNDHCLACGSKSIMHVERLLMARTASGISTSKDEG